VLKKTDEHISRPILGELRRTANNVLCCGEAGFDLGGVKPICRASIAHPGVLAVINMHHPTFNSSMEGAEGVMPRALLRRAIEISNLKAHECTYTTKR